VASLFPLSADWLPAISYCSGHPIEMDKPHILAEATKPVFGNLMSKFPLCLKYNISGSIGMKGLSIDITYDPC
jgi:hypothetical protein